MLGDLLEFKTLGDIKADPEYKVHQFGAAQLPSGEEYNPVCGRNSLKSFMIVVK